jgi:catechol 2,3-dioxygenase-like lactoylglutathione lyase family enzyme
MSAPSPFLRIEDIAFVRFRAPSLDRMSAFLSDFGMTVAVREKHRLFMRGTDPSPFVHVTEEGEPAFLGAGFRAPSLTELSALAQATGKPVEDAPWPGGGKCVRLTHPDGFAIDIVADQAAPDPLPLPRKPLLNDAAARPRIDASTAMEPGPSTVKRLGHVVLNVTDYAASRAWFQKHLGLIVSDEIRLAGPGSEIGAFMRCDRGATPADHHTVFIVGTGKPKFNHAAFEVAHFDDLMRGHHHLKSKGETAEWGVGRHILGSQIFDYWRDPYGNALEHWTDGDLFTAQTASRIASLQDLMGVQWGPGAPPTMA